MVGPLAAELRGLDVDLAGEVVEERVLEDSLEERGVLAARRFARVLDEELALRDGGGGEGVGLDDVGAGLEEALVDVADDVRPGEREDVAVVEQVLLGVGEALAAGVGLVEAVAADGRAHRAVEHEDPVAEEGFEFEFDGVRGAHGSLRYLEHRGVQLIN